MVSLVYDIFWLNINGNADDSDGGMEAEIRKFSLWMSYISFFFRVSLGFLILQVILSLVLWRDSIEFVSTIKQKQTLKINLNSDHD